MTTFWPNWLVDYSRWLGYRSYQLRTLRPPSCWRAERWPRICDRV